MKPETRKPYPKALKRPVEARKVPKSGAELAHASVWTEQVKAKVRQYRRYEDKGEMGILHYVRDRLEKQLARLVESDNLLSRTGHEILSLDDLLRALNSYEMNPAYRRRLEWAVHDSALYDPYRAEMGCTPAEVTAGSDLGSLLKECQRVEKELGPLHRDLLRVDLHATWRRRSLAEFVGESDGAVRRAMSILEEELYSTTMTLLMDMPGEDLMFWLGMKNKSYQKDEKPRRAYKDAGLRYHSGDQRAPAFEDYMPTPILLALLWIWEHYWAAAEEFKLGHQNIADWDLNECFSSCPDLASAAFESLLEKISHSAESAPVEHIEEVYRRLDPFEPTFAGGAVAQAES